MDTGDTGDEDNGDPRAPRPCLRLPAVLLRALPSWIAQRRRHDSSAAW